LGRSVMTKITRTFARLLISALPLVVLCAMAPTVANAQSIGKAASVKPQAEANARTLSAGSDVFSQETIRLLHGRTVQTKRPLSDSPRAIADKF
jgi:hypothetical protein